MFAGDRTEVILECQDDMMRYIIDQFGEETEIIFSDPKNKRKQILLYTHVVILFGEMLL